MDKTRKQNEIKNMERVWNIVTHPFYLEGIEKNKIAETDRIYCRHNMEHFLTVARLAYILKLERGYNVSKELIYAAAMLHDIGKWKQYTEGIPHEITSAEIADRILVDCGFENSEKTMILSAIRTHRKGEGREELSEILYDVDKISRDCFACPAQEYCNWTEEKKNMRITW